MSHFHRLASSSPRPTLIPTSTALPLLVVLLLASCECSESVRQFNPQLGVVGDSVDFGAVAVGEEAVRTLVVEARTPANVMLEMRIESDASGELGEAEGRVFEFADEPPTTIRGQRSETIPLQFRPSAVGTFAAMLVIESDDPDERQGGRRILLSGQGMEPSIEVAPDSVQLTAIACPLETQLEVCVDEAVVDISNAGDVVLRLDSVELRGVDGGDLPEGLALVRSIEPQLLPEGATAPARIRWRPLSSAVVAEGGGEEVDGGMRFDAELVVASADPERPKVTIPVTATALRNRAPKVCVDVVRVERRVYRLQGNPPSLVPGFEDVPEESYRFDDGAGGTEIRVQPGSRLTLDTSPCTVDPEGDQVLLDWTLAERPDGSAVTLASRTRPSTELEIDAAGLYEVRVTATDSLGESATAVRLIDAIPRDDLFVQLSWPQAPGPSPDLDLHLVREDGGALFCDKDCFFGNPSPAWSTTGGGQGNPRLLRDDQGTGSRFESIVLPEVSEEGGTFRVVVHYWDLQGTPPFETSPQVSIRLRGAEFEFDAPSPLSEPGEYWEVARIIFEPNSDPVALSLNGRGQFEPANFTRELLLCQ